MKKILIIGAGFLQSFVIQKAKEMGYETIAVDADPNAIGFQYADKYAVINIVDEKACLVYAKENQIDGVLTAATDYGVLTASYIAQEMGLPGLKFEVAKLIKNKYEVRKCLFENQVDDTEQVYLIDEDTNIKELSKIIIYPVMVKPCDGSGSRGASRVDNSSEMEAACLYAINGSMTQRAIIEPFINGHEYGAESLVINGDIYVLGIMKKWMTKPPYYAELGHAIPSELAPEIETKVKNCVTNAVKALGINCGSVNMDILLTNDNKVYIVDIGARMGGNMIGPCIIPYGTGLDYLAAMIKNAVGDEVVFKQSEYTAVASRLLAFKEGNICCIPDIKEIENKFDVEIYHHLEEGMHVNEYHTNLDGCGYIIAKAKRLDEAILKAEKAWAYMEGILFEN